MNNQSCYIYTSSVIMHIDIIGGAVCWLSNEHDIMQMRLPGKSAGWVLPGNRNSVFIKLALFSVLPVDQLAGGGVCGDITIINEQSNTWCIFIK